MAYLLFLFGWALFPTTQGDWVYPSFIHIAESLVDAEPGEMPQYSFGSAILCATYRGLCDASQRSTGESPVLAVCYVLLQLWSWEHFPVGRPMIRVPVHPYGMGNDPIDRQTMGTRWTGAKLGWARQRVARCYPVFHNEFEMLHEDDIIWSPWSPQFVLGIAPHGLSVQCTQDAAWWATTCHLVFSHIVEPYAPQRVMRQFGLFQLVPPPDGRMLPRGAHLQGRKGRKNDNWTAVQLPWTTAWEQTAHTEVVHEQRPYDVRTYHEYLQWYVPRTRTRLTRPPPERAEHVTHEDGLQMGLDRHRAWRRDDTFDRAQRIVDIGGSALRKGGHTVRGLLGLVKSMYDDAKQIVKNLSCGPTSDDVLWDAHRVDRPGSSPRSAHPSESGGRPSVTCRSS